MKLIVAGGREFDDYELLSKEICKLIVDTRTDSIISGTARGADSLGAQYANEHFIPLISMPADWNRYGKAAGYRRNEEMAKVADACLCFWDGESKGTKHMIDLAKEYDLHLIIVKY